jgi:GTP cyclohydrolase I
MQDAFTAFLRRIGENPAREGLKGTPERFAETLVELTSGYAEDLHTLVNGALYKKESDDLILIRDIEFYALCEHHLLPFFGKAHVAYIPGKHVIGFSKIPRIVDMYARRLQAQERLSRQIGEALERILKPKGVAILLEAEHLCMKMRGVEKQGARVTTQYFSGVFRRDTALRSDLLMRLS